LKGTSGKPVANLGGIRKEKVSDVNVLLAEIPFDKLQSGNYNLVVEAVNRDNTVLASRKASFQRSSQLFVPMARNDLSDLKLEGSFAEKITNPDSLKEYIKCLYPIADKNERAASAELVKGNSSAQLIKNGELRPFQTFILRFWASRDYADPEGAWLAYKAQVDLVMQTTRPGIKRDTKPTVAGFTSNTGCLMKSKPVTTMKVPTPMSSGIIIPCMSNGIRSLFFIVRTSRPMILN
jgi:hypothetical protein